MRLIIAGGRLHQLTEEDIFQLNKLQNISFVICGGASGIDADGEAWAKSKNIPVAHFHADWAKHGKKAGPLRNREMAKNADAVALFTGGKGTDSMYKEAQKAGLKIYDFRDNAQLTLNFDGDKHGH